MKFIHRFNCKAKLKKKKFYEFDIPEKEIKKGKKATFEKPHMYRGKIQLYGLYLSDKKLIVTMYHTFDSFTEHQ